MKEHLKGWIAGAVWGVAEVLRSRGCEVTAKDMLRSIASQKDIVKHADPIDLDVIYQHPWVSEVLNGSGRVVEGK